MSLPGAVIFFNKLFRGFIDLQLIAMSIEESHRVTVFPVEGEKVCDPLQTPQQILEGSR
jgi:hypothetical protein